MSIAIAGRWYGYWPYYGQMHQDGSMMAVGGQYDIGRMLVEPL